MGDNLMDMLSGADSPIDWNDGQVPADELKWLLRIEMERARQAREGDKGLSIYSAFPEIAPEGQAYLVNNYGNAKPGLPPVEGLNLPEPRAAMDPAGEGVSLWDWLKFQGWAPARTAQKPGEPYMGPLPPMPAEMSAGLRDRKVAPQKPEPKKPAKKPAKKREEKRATPAAETRTAMSKSGKRFVVGKVYTNAKGQRFRFMADGSFKKV